MNITINDKIVPERSSGKITYSNNDLHQSTEILVPITEFNLVDMFEVEESNIKKRRYNITDEGVHHDKANDADAFMNKDDVNKSKKSIEVDMIESTGKSKICKLLDGTESEAVRTS
jgi:hypothetical protein